MTIHLPLLADERPLPPGCLEEFRTKGHTLVRALASPDEAEAWRPLIERVTVGHQLAPTGNEALRRALTQSQNLWCRDPDVRRFVFAPRFGRIAADLLGVDRVRIYHDQAVFKWPGSAYTPYHQDQYFFPLERDDVVTMWMPLVPVSEEVGSLTFASGSHLLGDLGALDLADAAHEHFSAAVEREGLEVMTYGAMAPGDATFHRGWTLHTAPANPSPDLRAVMTVIWHADGLCTIEPEHDWHAKDFEKWLPGVRPGEPAAGPLNPVVWDRHQTPDHDLPGEPG